MKKILIIGLVARLVLMVLTYHGDLSFIWDGPMQLVTRTGIPDQLYPPLSFLTVLVLSPLYWLSKFVGWWVLKLPYIVVDIVILRGLFKLLPKSLHRQALVLWWLNPVVLYSTYAMGQMEIVMTAFLMISILWIKKSRELATLAISIAAAYKTIPVFFLPGIVAYLGNNWKQRLKLLLIGLSLPVGLGIIFSQIKGFDVMVSYFPPVARRNMECSLRPDALLGCAETIVGSLGYTILLISSLVRKKEINQAGYTGFLFSIAALFLISSRIVVIHRFVLLMPFLIILALKKQWSVKLIWGWMLMLFLAYVYTWPLQWGLIARWYPEATERLALREWLTPWINYEHVALLFKMITDVLLIKFILNSK